LPQTWKNRSRNLKLESLRLRTFAPLAVKIETPDNTEPLFGSGSSGLGFTRLMQGMLFEVSPTAAFPLAPSLCFLLRLRFWHADFPQEELLLWIRTLRCVQNSG